MKNTLLSYLSVMSVPAFAARNSDDFFAHFGWGVMIFAGFGVLLALALLPMWLYKIDHKDHRNV